MILTLIMLLIFVGVLIRFYLYASNGFWTTPMPICIFYYILNYPLKSLYNVIYNPDYLSKDPGHLLLYVTVYFILFVLSYIYISKKDSISINYNYDYKLLTTDRMVRVGNISFYILVGGFLYKFLLGGFYTWGEKSGTSILENIIFNIMILQYAILFLMIHMARFKNKIYYIKVLVITGFIIFECLLTTSKSPIFYLIILILFTNSFHRIKTSPILVSILLTVGIAYFFYSYTSRFSGIAYNEVEGSSISNTFDETILGFDAYYDRIMDSIFDRIELLDNLIIMDSRYSLIQRGYYQLSSLVEVINFVPRIIWPSRPDLNFNIFTQYELLGYRAEAVTMSVGRAGEGYFLFNYLGVVMGVFYGAFFYKIYKVFFLQPNTGVKIIIYVNILFAYIIQDNYLTQGMFTIIFSSSFLYFLYKLTPK